MGAEAAQLALAAHHAFEDGADAGVADQGRVGLRLAVEQRIEPHVADRVEPFFPAHCAGVVDALAHVLGLLGRERVLDEDKAVLFEAVQFGFEVVHSASPCGAGSGAGARVAGLSLDAGQCDALDEGPLREKEEDHNRQHHDGAGGHQPAELGVVLAAEEG